MRAKIIAALAALVVLGGVYLAGAWPQRQALAQAEAQVQSLQARLTAADDRVRIGEILGRTLTLKEVAARRNFGQAQDLSSSFFDAVRAEAGIVADAGLRRALDDVLARRDEVTAALARSDPAAADLVHDVELRLRRGLNLSTPPAAPAGP